MSPRRSAEDAAATRAALVDKARELFSARGYAATHTEDLVAELGLSRGALYHHFRTKKDLFTAVVEHAEEDLVRRVVEAALEQSEPVAQLRAGLGTYLDLCVQPDVARIVLIDGPSVLGWDAWLAIDERHAFGHVVAILEALMSGGFIDDQPVEPLANVVFGALTRAGLAIARASNPAAARTEMGALLDRFLAAMEPAARPA